MSTFINLLKDRAYSSLDISTYTPDIHGWIDKDFDELFTRFIKPDTSTIIEVGTWKGRSTIQMANCLKKINPATTASIIAIDTWLGAPEFWTWGLDDPTRGISLNCSQGYPQVFYTFTKNVKAYGHHNIIAPLPISSVQGADVLQHYNIQADIIYVDAAHEYEPVKADIEKFWRLLKRGGVMFGDDYILPHWPGVVKAVNEFCKKNKLKLKIHGVMWYIFKP
jgi:hypothetical protein